MGKDCPEIEEIAAYVDRALRPGQQRKMEKHLVDCRTCRQMVMLIVKSKAVVPDPPEIKPAKS